MEARLRQIDLNIDHLGNQQLRAIQERQVVTTEAEWVTQLKVDGTLRDELHLLDEANKGRLKKFDQARKNSKDNKLWDFISTSRAAPGTSESNTTKKPKKKDSGTATGTAPTKTTTKTALAPVVDTEPAEVTIEGTQTKFVNIMTGMMDYYSSTISWTSLPKDRHEKSSYGTRKPDIPSYLNDSGSAGPHSITLIGDLKPAVSDDDVEFSPSQVCVLIYYRYAMISVYYFGGIFVRAQIIFNLICVFVYIRWGTF